MFWVPNRPEHQVAGELSYDEDRGLRLALDGVLSSDLAALTTGSSSYALIHGLAGGAEVTLLGSMQSGFLIQMPGIGRETLRVGAALDGALLAQPDPTFNSIEFNCTHLIDWVLPQPAFNVAYGMPVERGWRAEYLPPQSVDTYLADGALLTLRAVSTSSPGTHSFSAGVDAAIEIIPRTAMTMPELVSRYVVPLRDLVSFATDVPSPIRWISVGRPDVVTDVGGTMHPVEIGVTTGDLVQPHKDVRNEESIQLVFQLIAAADVPGGIPAALRSWLATYERSREAINRFLGEQMQPTFWFPARVANLVKALEAYDRLNREKKTVAGAADRVSRILASVGAADASWLEPRLAHADDPALPNRLRRVVKRAKPVVTPVLDHQHVIVTALAEMRNADAHPGDRTKVAPNAVPMLQALEWARWTMIGNLLLDLGMTSENAAAALRKYQPFARALNLLARLEAESKLTEQT